MIKLVAIDLDGTLLNEQKQISAANRQALLKAKALGVKIVITTGRPLAAIQPYLAELQLLEAGDYSITFNGGLVQKNDTGEILSRKALSTPELLELAQLAESLDLPLDILSNQLVYQLATSKRESLYPSMHKTLSFEAKALNALADDEVYNKAVIAYDGPVLDQQIKQIPEVLKGKYEIAKSRENLLEFLPKGVDKAAGLDFLGSYLKIDAKEMMAIGDEANDLPMIAYAKYGVAMANAVPAVKQAAAIITDSNEADGVCAVIENYIL